MKELLHVASPWWVNLLIFVPLAVFLWFRKHRLKLSSMQLWGGTVFGAAFGFVEAAVVVYLRAALGFLPGFLGTFAGLIKKPFTVYHQEEVLKNLPPSLLTVEIAREGATIIMLISVALLAASRFRERSAMFLWVFATWDIAYYLGLWLTVRWPPALSTPDVLFLIPVPWYGPVWFPLLASGLTMIAIALGRGK